MTARRDGRDVILMSLSSVLFVYTGDTLLSNDRKCETVKRRLVRSLSDRRSTRRQGGAAQSLSHPSSRRDDVLLPTFSSSFEPSPAPWRAPVVGARGVHYTRDRDTSRELDMGDVSLTPM